jgi:hypothetical protein
VYAAINVIDGVVDYLMLEVPQTFLRFQRIGIQGRTGFDVLANFSMERLALAI